MQLTPHRNHRHTLFTKDSRIVDSERITLDGTRVRREQNLVVFHPLLLPHPISNLLLIFQTDTLVFLNILFEHRCKDRNNSVKDKEKMEKSFIILASERTKPFHINQMLAISFHNLL